jgi:hypothetical protein
MDVDCLITQQAVSFFKRTLLQTVLHRKQKYFVAVKLVGAVVGFGYNDWIFETSEFDSRGEQEMYFFYTGSETQ